MLFAILFITFVSFQPEVFGSYTNPLMHYQEPSDSDEDMRLYLAHRRGIDQKSDQIQIVEMMSLLHFHPVIPPEMLVLFLFLFLL